MPNGNTAPQYRGLYVSVNFLYTCRQSPRTTLKSEKCGTQPVAIYLLLHYRRSNGNELRHHQRSDDKSARLLVASHKARRCARIPLHQDANEGSYKDESKAIEIMIPRCILLRLLGRPRPTWWPHFERVVRIVAPMWRRTLRQARSQSRAAGLNPRCAVSDWCAQI